jgi:hypothetical protein
MLAQQECVDDLIAGLAAKPARVKFGAGKALMALSAESPEMLYSHFAFFAAMMGHENNVLRWNALRILANLAPVDRENKLDAMLDAYLAPIAGPQMIAAAHAIHGGAAIAVAKPYLRDRIVRKILRVERAAYQRPECANIAIGHAIEALGTLPQSPEIRAFATRQLKNTRRSTAAKAAKLLARTPVSHDV